jgi:hypothetical protein
MFLPICFTLFRALSNSIDFFSEYWTYMICMFRRSRTKHIPLCIKNIRKLNAYYLGKSRITNRNTTYKQFGKCTCDCNVIEWKSKWCSHFSYNQMGNNLDAYRAAVGLFHVKWVLISAMILALTLFMISQLLTYDVPNVIAMSLNETNRTNQMGMLHNSHSKSIWHPLCRECIYPLTS